MAPLPVPTKADSQTLSEAVKSTDSSFQVLYFGLHARGELTRNILSYSGAKWEELTPEWPAQKDQTPFGVLPVVYETTSNGTVLELSESQAIERYLAKKFHLYGQNEYEQHKVEEFLSSTDGGILAFSTKVVNNTSETRVEDTNKFYTEVLLKFIAIHEAHLEKNGSNGHYVGQSTTLADLKTALFIDSVLSLRPSGAGEVPFSAEKSPNLWKVRETVNSHGPLAAWKKSQRCQELDVATKGFFKFN
ncbi:MAG: hypothetical protein J3Q66DRAFT_209649 [Benniella sp.]|nr:MAG: hypothetical protein J3Q66DRAFT_209649 [Benniella sp.]